MKKLVSLLALAGFVSIAGADVHIYMKEDGKVIIKDKPMETAEIAALEETEAAPAEPTVAPTGLRASEIELLRIYARDREQRAAARPQPFAGQVSERRRVCTELDRIINDPHGMSRSINSRHALYEYNKRGCTARSSRLGNELNPIVRGR